MLRLGYVSRRGCEEQPCIPSLPPPECLSYTRNWDLLRVVEEALKVSFESYQSQAFGALIGNGSTWNGMVGMLINDTIDIAEPSLAETFARHEVADFPHAPFFVPSSPFLTCERRDEVLSTFSLGEIFSLQIWLLLLASFVALFFQFFISIKLSTKLSIFDSASKSVEKLLAALIGFSYGGPCIGQSASFRIVELAWGLLLLVMIQGILSARLYESARMIPASPLENFETFIDKIKSGKIVGIVTFGGTTDAQLLKTHEKFAPIRDRIAEMKSIVELNAADLTRYARYDGYQSQVNMALRWEKTGTIKCYMNDFRLTSLQWLSFAVHKGSVGLVEKLNRLILRLHETGVLIAITERSDAQWNSLPIQNKAWVGFDRVEPTIQLCGWALTFGTCVFFMERLVKLFKQMFFKSLSGEAA